MSRIPALLSLVALCGPGCSVYMAATFPTDKDLTVVDAGRSRVDVERELGGPTSQMSVDGRDVHVYSFEDGIPIWANGLRAVGWAAADVFTIFLWEALGTPIEAAWRASTKTTAEVAYDGNGRVAGAVVRDRGGDVACATGTMEPPRKRPQEEGAPEPRVAREGSQPSAR